MSRTSKISVVIDTNVFVSCLSRKSVNHLVYKSLIEDYYNLHITSEILLEYDEKISAKYDAETAELFLTSLHELPNVFKQDIYFYWKLIKGDEDDNKFVDCTIVSNADYLVTNDKHFSPLKALAYPKLNIVTIEEFVRVIKSLYDKEEGNLYG